MFFPPILPPITLFSSFFGTGAFLVAVPALLAGEYPGLVRLAVAVVASIPTVYAVVFYGIPPIVF
jgi:hypothetical protein